MAAPQSPDGPPPLRSCLKSAMKAGAKRVRFAENGMPKVCCPDIIATDLRPSTVPLLRGRWRRLSSAFDRPLASYP